MYVLDAKGYNPQFHAELRHAYSEQQHKTGDPYDVICNRLYFLMVCICVCVCAHTHTHACIQNRVPKWWFSFPYPWRNYTYIHTHTHTHIIVCSFSATVAPIWPAVCLLNLIGALLILLLIFSVTLIFRLLRFHVQSLVYIIHWLDCSEESVQIQGSCIFS